MIFFYLKKNPLFVGGTESSDRSNFTGEPPFLSGTMVRRDLMEHSSQEKTEDIYGNDADSSDCGEYYIKILVHYVIDRRKTLYIFHRFLKR